MTKFDFSNPGHQYVLRPSAYKLQRAFERIMHEDPKQLTKLLTERNPFASYLTPEERVDAIERMVHESPEQMMSLLLAPGPKGMHIGSAVALQFAYEYLDEVKAELGDDLLGCIVYGGVARGLKTHRLPKDIDILFIAKRGKNRIKAKPHRRIEVFVYDEDMVGPETMLEDNAQSSFVRRTFALPILILHGYEYVSNLRDVARKALRMNDIREFVDFQVKKWNKELIKKGEQVPDPETLRQMVIEELDISDELIDLL